MKYPSAPHFQPELIRALGDFGAFIRERRDDAVGGVLDPADYLATTRFMIRPDDPNARVLPEGAGEIKLLWDYYALALGPQRLRQIVDGNYWQSLTTVFLKDANFVGTARLMRDLRDYERKHFAPQGIKISFAGDVAVSQSLIRGIVTTQLQSLIWSLAGIFLVTSFFGNSWRWGFYCLLPSALAVVVKFAVMGWVDIPLGVATSMFAAMTLGIGVNCTIHLLEGFSQAWAAGKSPAEALSQSLRLTGTARAHQHAGRFAGVWRADALAGAGQRAARPSAGAGFGELFYRVTAAVAGPALLATIEGCGRDQSWRGSNISKIGATDGLKDGSFAERSNRFLDAFSA